MEENNKETKDLKNLQDDFAEDTEEETFGEKHKTSLIVGGVILFVLAAIAFYFLYWIKTPGYSVKIVHQAIVKHDYATFEKHVDLKTVYNKAFDSIIADSIGGGNINKNDPSQALAFGILQGIKNAAVPNIIADTKRFVETGKYDDGKGNMADSLTEGILENSGVTEDMEFKGVGATTMEGSTALVEVNVFDKRVNKDFTLKVKLTENDDKTWRIIDIANLKEYLDAHKVANSKKLAEVNKDKQEEINKFVEIKDGITGEIMQGDGMFSSPSLKVNLNLLVHTEKAFDNCFINLAVIDPATESQLFVGVIKTEIAAGENNRTVPITFTWPLNQFVSSQKKIIQGNLQGTDLQAHVVAIHAADGTELTLLEKVPSLSEQNKK